ncbi:hypothetical protein NSPZN2_30415 [Nitrospira defluvii]|uniref:Uncharacterized protein n=1 Tax=Nitrospira defluvii TaxID=330214 RepID=A0ABM8RJE4_9BACT|nr:hypothetical protein NSPZN2_30415 [Nitrospira defluvii]
MVTITDEAPKRADLLRRPRESAARPTLVTGGRLGPAIRLVSTAGGGGIWVRPRQSSNSRRSMTP